MATVIKSHARVRGARRGPALFGLALLLGLSPVTDAAVTVAVHGDHVAIVATDATLRSILEAIARQRVVDVSASIPLQSRITLVTEPESLPRLLKRLLRPYSYTLIEHGTSSGRIPRLHVFSDSNPGAPIGWSTRSSVIPGYLDQAIADLASPDEEVREEAVLTLSDSGDPDAAAYFLATLGDPSPDVRDAARAALEDMETLPDSGFVDMSGE